MKKLSVGRVTLNESEFRTLSEKPKDGGGRSISISGVEIRPLMSKEAMRALAGSISGMALKMVPVTFSDKSEWDGYYTVNGCGATVTDWDSEGVGILEWEFDLDLVGSANDIDIQSRLSGPPALLNDFEGAGVRWHSPPIGHSAYWSGPSQPAQITRVGSDGAQIVYTGVDLDTSPRFHCPAGEYGLGRVRFVDSDGVERAGQSFSVSPEGWSLSNGLVRVLEVDGSFVVSVWDDGWKGKLWTFFKDEDDLGVPTSVSLLRNDYEHVTVRCLWNLPVSGRAQADLTLRRGSRFVEVYFKSMLQDVLGIKKVAPEAGYTATGYVRANVDDGDGNQYIVGSAKAFDSDLVNGGISKAATKVLDAFIGVAVGGSGAVGSDMPDALYQQYLGAPSERILGVRL